MSSSRSHNMKSGSSTCARSVLQSTKSQPGSTAKLKTEASTSSNPLVPTLTEGEEIELYNCLSVYPKSPFVNRLRRKLALRQFKRRSNLPIFNLDDRIIKYVDRSQKSDQRLAVYFPEVFRPPPPPPPPAPSSPTSSPVVSSSSTPESLTPSGSAPAMVTPLLPPTTSKPPPAPATSLGYPSGVVVIAPDLSDAEPVSKVMPTLAALLAAPSLAKPSTSIIVSSSQPRAFSKRKLDDEMGNLVVAEEQAQMVKRTTVRTHRQVSLPSEAFVPEEHVPPPPPLSFAATLSGYADNADRPALQSSYSLRVLKPFIRRDTETITPRMALLTDIRKRLNPNAEAYPIDYVYLRPQFCDRVNELLREHFWPGIDVREWLEFPEYSVVCMYRQLVIGCGFISTEGYVSYLVVRPEWRQKGISRFMLYHLIQTCPGKDITLHVAASNPAMILYQKFGFKPEEFILKFYERYLPENSKECKHAYFLRLRR